MSEGLDLAENDNGGSEAKTPSTGKLPPSKRRRWMRLALLLILLMAVLLGYGPAMDRVNQRRVEAYRKDCKTATAAGDWKTLEAVANRWLELEPDNNDALLFGAEACIQLDQLERAVDLLGRVDDSYHGALQALAGRGDILFSDLNLPLEAEKNWKRMLSINERAGVAHQRLIYFYAMTLQRRKMVRQIKMAMKYGCEPPEAYSYLLMQNVLNFSDGFTLLTRWRSKYPDNEILEVAHAVYSAKKTADNGMATFGIQTVIPGDKTPLENALRKYPSNPELLALKIDLAIFEGDQAAVADLLARASTEAEQDSRFWRYRGWLLKERNKFEASAKSFEHAIEITPFEWQSRWLLADVYRHLNQPEKADKQSKIASVGKELQEKLFERPTARDVDAELIDMIYRYLLMIDAQDVLEALQRRR